MTHPPEDNAIRAAMESLTENGLDGMGEALHILMNEAMKIERSEDRVGHANGFKDKTVRTRVGDVTLQVPPVRGIPADLVGFYPRSLEKGLRSERAPKLAIAEMYVKGVSTRKVAQITQELCGVEVHLPRSAVPVSCWMKSWRCGARAPWVRSLIWSWMPAMKRCATPGIASM